MKIHLGCGKKILEGFVNVDQLDYGQQIVGDAFEFLEKQENNSVDLIRAEHFLEHFNREEVIRWLWLAHSKLNHLGLFEIVVPGWKRPESYFLCHKIVFTTETFRMLGVEEYCETYDLPYFDIVRLVENDRGDIHCTLGKI